MNTEWKGKCLGLLGAMNSQRPIEEQIEIYSIVLDVIGEEYGLKTVQHAILHDEWRPSPARLRQIAARVAAPYPSAEDCYSEILDKAIRVGAYGVPHPQRENILLEGQPPMSHPIMDRIVAHLGGWRFICEGDAQMQEGLKKQVGSSHATVSGQWEEEVIRQFELPRNQRTQAYFRTYKPYRPALATSDGFYLPLPQPTPKDWDESVPMPPIIREMIDCIERRSSTDLLRLSDAGTKYLLPPGEGTGTKSVFRDGLTKDERAAVQAEEERIRNLTPATPEQAQEIVEEIKRKRGLP